MIGYELCTKISNNQEYLGNVCAINRNNGYNVESRYQHNLLKMHFVALGNYNYSTNSSRMPFKLYFVITLNNVINQIK